MLQSEILIRGDRRQVSFLSAFIVYATSHEMKSKWANLKESRLVEQRCDFLYFFDYFAICFTGLCFYVGAILSDIKYIRNALLCCLDSLYVSRQRALPSHAIYLP